MGNDNSGCFADWPKPKKSRTEKSQCMAKWEYLPSVILHDIFSYLNIKDRVNASSTCLMWRNNIYHPNFWRDVTFEIDQNMLEKAQYLRAVVGHIVTNAVVKFNSLAPECVTEFLLLLQHFKFNDNLQSLILEPSYSYIVSPSNDIFGDTKLLGLPNLIKMCCKKQLTSISLGLNECLLENVTEYLELLAKYRPEKVTLLGLASIKDDPTDYLINKCNVDLLASFSNLKILSIDYDILNDQLLDSLKCASNLERLVVHIHGVWEGHPGTSEEAWIDFKEFHPKCFVRVSFIHSFDEVNHMQDILKKNMPLSHIKVFFCENVNLIMLDLLPRYNETLKSIMWVDSLCHDENSNSWNIIKRIEESDPYEPADPDPLIIMSWACKQLEEIILIGYKYHEEDLLAIARLRNGLKKLEIPLEDILFQAGEEMSHKNIAEISKLLGREWKPLATSDLHPVLMDPIAGDSDEYLMPILLADIQ